MQKKFGTILDEKLINRARAFCQQEHTPINRLVQTAIAEYLQRHKRPVGGLSAVETSFGSIKLTPKSLAAVIDEDLYDID